MANVPMPRTLHINTPLLSSPSFRSAAGRPVLFKMDALQPSGSFKLRGVGRFCGHAVEAGATAIICASGGNAGFAAAYAGRQLGVPVTIVVPTTTSPEAKQAIQGLEAKVEVHGSVFDEAADYAQELAARTGAAYVHPFNHPLIWDGHATLIDEVVASGAAFDCVVTSVGGGGLLLGIVAGLRRNGLSDIPVIAVETEGADSLNRSVAAGEIITLPAITSIATSLGARRVADEAFAVTKSHPMTSVTVTDAQAVSACLEFADAHRVLVEPACGAAIAVLAVHPQLMARFARPLVEVCGGIGVSLRRLSEWKARFGGSASG
jgi:L-serine/L-threonine ammonia-lyase